MLELWGHSASVRPSSTSQWQQQVSHRILTEPTPLPQTHSMSGETEAQSWGRTEVGWGDLDLLREQQSIIPPSKPEV